MNRIGLIDGNGDESCIDMDRIINVKEKDGKARLYFTDGDELSYFQVKETKAEVLRLEEIGLKSKPTSAEIGRLYERINELGRMNHYRNQQ